MTPARAFWLSLALMLAGRAVILLRSALRTDANGLLPVDLRIQGHDLGAARTFLGALTPGGTSAFLGPQRVADTIFPVGATGMMAGLILGGLKRRSGSTAFAAPILPLSYFALDMAETAAVAGPFRTDPATPAPETAARASAITAWKFRLINAALAVTALALASHATPAIARRRR